MIYENDDRIRKENIELNSFYYDLKGHEDFRKKVNIDYDWDEYNYEVLYEQELLILNIRRGRDRWKRDSYSPIHVFDLSKTTYIEQVNHGDTTYFVTYEFGKDNKNKAMNFYYSTGNYLILDKRIENINVDAFYHIKKGKYIIKQDNNDFAYIYNMFRYKELSLCGVEDVYCSSDVMNYIDPKYKNTILIREKIRHSESKNFEDNLFCDYVTYGIDLDDFDIVTNIHSEEQVRYIKKYNTKETIEYYGEEDKNSARHTGAQGLATINNEVKKYLDELYERSIYGICPSQKKPVLIDHNINEEHVKNFKRRYFDENFKPQKRHY